MVVENDFNFASIIQELLVPLPTEKGTQRYLWDVTETISADIPASSNNDTYLREFASTYSDQSAGPEAVALYIRPGGTNKLSVANSLTAGYEIMIYGQD